MHITFILSPPCYIPSISPPTAIFISTTSFILPSADPILIPLVHHLPPFPSPHLPFSIVPTIPSSHTFLPQLVTLPTLPIFFIIVIIFPFYKLRHYITIFYSVLLYLSLSLFLLSQHSCHSPSPCSLPSIHSPQLSRVCVSVQGWIKQLRMEEFILKNLTPLPIFHFDGRNRLKLFGI